jgi:ABC-type transport system involved in multi-copper enzyme maturation permease subunit
VNPVTEVGLIFARELRRNFRSVKGVLLLALSLLGGTLTTLALAKLDGAQKALGDLPPELIAQKKAEFFSTMVFHDEVTGQYIAGAPTVLFFVTEITVLFSPALVAILGFDLIAGDLQQRTVRYWAVRSRRSSYYLGKYLGLWAVAATIVVAMNALMWGVCVARSDATLGATLSWGLRFLAVSLPIAGCWAGLVVWVGSMSQSPMVSLLSTLAAIVGLWVLHLVGSLQPSAAAVSWLYPNGYDLFLMSPKVDRFAIGFGAALAFIGATVGGGTALFLRRDV